MSQHSGLEPLVQLPCGPLSLTFPQHLRRETDQGTECSSLSITHTVLRGFPDSFVHQGYFLAPTVCPGAGCQVLCAKDTKGRNITGPILRDLHLLGGNSSKLYSSSTVPDEGDSAFQIFPLAPPTVRPRHVSYTSMT